MAREKKDGRHINLYIEREIIESLEKYCERMYNYGYMDKDYNWTPAATNVINNMNASNMQKLDENAKQIVQERIDSGEMEAIDSPYLTYDQKQELIKKHCSRELTAASSNSGRLTSDSFLRDFFLD